MANKTKESSPMREDVKARKNGRWILAGVVGLAVYNLRQQRSIVKLQPNLSSLSFARELDDVMLGRNNGSRNGTYDIIETEARLGPYSIATRRPQRVLELPYEEQMGSWTGNHWVPPNGWHYFSNQELLTVYKDKSIMWVGDSLARRAAVTMYGILNETANAKANASNANVNVNVPVDAIDNGKLLNVNRGTKASDITDPCQKWIGCQHQPRWCRAMPGGGTGDYVYAMKNGFTELIAFVADEVSGKSNITENFDTIIIGMGNWNIGKQEVNTTLSSVTAAIDVLGKLQSVGKTIIWRTSGFRSQDKPGISNEVFFVVNKRVLDQINSISTRLQQENNTVSNLTCINWPGAIFPRSFGKTRISGDTWNHYGLEARLVFIQMVTNQLASRQRLEF
jgi:hypothetical protein